MGAEFLPKLPSWHKTKDKGKQNRICDELGSLDDEKKEVFLACIRTQKRPRLFIKNY